MDKEALTAEISKLEQQCEQKRIELLHTEGALLFARYLFQKECPPKKEQEVL